jgi:hypothetical protein
VRGKPRLHIPSTLRIGRIRWRVRLVKGLVDRENLKGSCHPGTRTIELDAGLSRRELEVTFVHEILHALWPAGMVPRQEEPIVLRMEEKLYQLLASGQLYRESP